MSPFATLAASLRALAARAAEHSSPIVLSQVLAEGFGVIAGTLEEADRVVGAAIADALQSLPLTEADREALRNAGLAHLVGANDAPDAPGEIAPPSESGGVVSAGFIEPVPVDQVAAEPVSELQLAVVATAPRVTLAEVEANIVGEYYINPGEAYADGHGGRAADHDRALSVLTVCVLVLRNGFTVTGESACASPENFDAGIGQRLARENAVRKIWPLMGYELRSKLEVA